MATATVVLSEACGGLVRWEADYDDLTLLITALRCVNGSDQAAGVSPAAALSRVWLTTDPSRVYPPTRPLRTQPGATDVQAVPDEQGGTVAARHGPARRPRGPVEPRRRVRVAGAVDG
jgi:hypothetical protein